MEERLAAIERRLREAAPSERDYLRDLLRIGLHSGVEVTLNDCGHTLSQAYCSALPVAYSLGISPKRWEPLACLALEGAYEATVYAAALNRVQTGNPRLFLTLLGGGAFGNLNEWIFPAMQRAIGIARGYGLEVYVVSRRSSNPLVQGLMETHETR